MAAQPSSIKLHRKSKRLELLYNDTSFALSCEYLRVYSPSAEVRGHGQGQEILQLNKHNVAITQLEPVGNYALKIFFDDGHDTGLYTWEYLHELCVNQQPYWQDYLKRLKQAGHLHHSELINIRPIE